MGDIYTHGHHESVLAMHADRTVETSAAYLLALLQPGLDVLDVGCGPGSITAGLAERTAPGTTIGIDVDPGIVARARRSVPGARFEAADVHALPFEDASFDVVHAHQVLQHLSDPVAALTEMRRVVRRGGVVAARDVDYASMIWSPASPLLDRWLDLYHRVARANGGEPDAGRRLPAWFREAGLGDLSVSASAVWYADPPGRSFWGDGWRRRAVESAFARQAVAGGHATERDLIEIAEAWGTWAHDPSAFLAYTNTEVIGRE
ncbi:MAG TPA: methyltransferase domain-containing protein [Acidimicrobiia bacterium]|nr:methyltransferase domain-containing protein [Acidimicrobiia bacterium]